MKLEIRPAKVEDATTLAQLGRKTFYDAFAADNTSENMELYLNKTFSVEKQRTEILDRKSRISIVWVDGVAMGYYHLYSGQPNPSVVGEKPIELKRLYVDRAFYGKGISVNLMDDSLVQAKLQGFRTMWLGVWEKNFRALKFYKKYSFQVVGGQKFKLGNDLQYDFVMSRQI